MEQIPSSADMTQIAIAKKLLTLENQIKGGLSWFFWIAGLSVVNSIIFFAGDTTTFVIGLGITQLIDGIMFAFAREANSETGTIIRVIGLCLDFIFAGIFVACGVLGRKRLRWAIISGMVLYALDGLISIVFSDWLGAFFHAFALLGLWGGLKAINELTRMEKSQLSGDIASLQKLIASQPPVGAPAVQYKISHYGLRVLIIFGVVILGFISLSSAFSIIGVVILTVAIGQISSGNFWLDIVPFILMIAVTGIGLFGTFKLVQILYKKA